MKKFLLFAFALILTACGTDSHHFKIEGRLLHLNQGEFYVYSPTGDLEGLDTLKVQAGRFALEIPCERPMVLMIVLPNFTQQVVFAEPGKTVDIKGDASHMSEMTIKGTDDNKLMDSFRKRIAQMSPPEQKRIAIEVIKENPETAVAPYLLMTYVLDDRNPDYAQASTLIKMMEEKQKDNGMLKLLNDKVNLMQQSALNGRMPNFVLTDINGQRVSSNDLAKAPLALVVAWSSLNYESTGLMQQMKMWQQQSGGRITFLTVSLDPSIEQCRTYLKNNQMNYTTICDGNMFDSKGARIFGFYNLPDNALFRNGQLIGHSLSQQELSSRLQPYLSH